MHVKLPKFQLICLVVVLAVYFEIPLYATAHRRKSHSKKISSLSLAATFVEKTDAKFGRLLHEMQLAQFALQSNITDYNKEVVEKIYEKHDSFSSTTQKHAKKFNWKSFKVKNSTLYRWFRLFHEGNIEGDEIQQRGSKIIASQRTTEDIYQEAKVCPYKSKHKKDCSLTMEPDVTNIMSTSHDPDELLSIWTQYRNETGRKMRRVFLESLKDLHKYAKRNGYSDYGKIYRKSYESKHFEKEMEETVEQLLPLYRHLHAYVRRKLANYYKSVDILDNGPIPAHLLGNLYAQEWGSLYKILNPFPKKKVSNVTEKMLKMKMKPIDLFIMAEKFFVSIGFKRMTPHFWAFSMMEKPTDREVECHATAYDFSNDKDFRIKMCTKIDVSSLNTVHHEMGHIEYYMHMTPLLHVFRNSANAGYHEAVGEVATLSASTPAYLKAVLFKDEEFTEDEETNILHLLDVGLKYIPSVPYTYIVDAYRYNVFNGSTTKKTLNRDWWNFRLKYQGVCPPVERTEEDFDPGAKYHVAYNIEYMRYFYATVLAFQMHKALCDEGGYKGPLHKCCIYKNKKAGKLFKKVLSLGKSKPPTVVMKILTNNKAKRLSYEPILEYFKPLLKWLKKENKGEKIGWESEDSMKCPSSKLQMK